MTSIQEAVWPVEKAQAWARRIPWTCGFNYVPSTAVNATEMWQEDTFDPATCRREMGYAERIGLNACRVFLPFLVWEADPAGFLSRVDAFLEIAAGCGFAAVPVLFDDCSFAGRQPSPGPQAAPVPGVHNSGWTGSPGSAIANDDASWPRLERYVHSVIGRYCADSRVLFWDIYNEPGNDGRGEGALRLLRAAFGWARDARPSQPVTAAVWTPDTPALNGFLIDHSDIVTFHDYNDLEQTRTAISDLKESGRPVFCTEWLRRGFGSTFHSHLPAFRAENVGCFFWGLVNGRTQTHFPWGSPPGAAEPEMWFHDLLRPDGTPFQEEEVDIIRGITGQGIKPV